LDRKQRLTAAVGHSRERIQLAIGGQDAQALFEALGECLAWLCALDDLLDGAPGYKGNHRRVTVDGLRYARNQLVHGEQVVDVTQQELTITPQVIVYPAAARIIRSTCLPLWTFRQTLPPPPPDWHQPRLVRAYTARVAGREVQLVLDDTIEWMGRLA
jgi:hypothetical protein